MKVYVKRKPRSLILSAESHVLVVRALSTHPSQYEKVHGAVELVPAQELDMSGTLVLTDQCHGCLGLMHVGGHVFLSVISARQKVSQPTTGRTVWRILGVEFYCLTRQGYDFSAKTSPQTPEEEHPCAQLWKLLSNGSFYYSTDFDLTAVLQKSGQDSQNYANPLDESFMWNTYMIHELAKFRSRLPMQDQKVMDSSGFLACVIRGFVESVNVQIGTIPGRLSVISRQSYRRAGTRFNARGIDDNGNVANFVETETVLYLENRQQFGFVQLRGSMPLFWEQDANLLGAKVSIQRSPEATQPAFQKHFENLIERFGGVHCVNLLGAKVGEAALTGEFAAQLQASSRDAKDILRYTHFDFHMEVGSGNGYGAASKVIDRIQDSMLEFGFYSYNPETSQNETEQIGVFRTNCLDCLDRTNLVQQLISKDALDLFLDYYNLPANDELWAAHSTLWADNGDQLSQIYAGTNALKSSYTRSGRMNLAGALSDVTKSVSRLYVNNFVDKSRQNTIEILLGLAEGQLTVTIYDPINDYVQSDLNARRKEYTTEHRVQIFAGTFNVGGLTPDVDLTPWLFPEEMTQYPDLYLIGIQELVELTAGQILNADFSRRKHWEQHIGDCLNKHEHYVMLRSGQLVGSAVLVFVKRSEVMHITRVEGTSKKTAFGGITGNKGGVAVSFMYATTPICFVNSHFAAGQNNVEERHHNYKSLSAGIRFSRGRRIKDHETIIWLGDFNFRVELPNETVRVILDRESEKKWESVIPRLLKHDQLIIQMERGETFPYYREHPIKFLPTYKYDFGSDEYDTSDKARVPSWTDRILSLGKNVRQLAYNSCNTVRFSDHRPVYAIYDVSVQILNRAKREALYTELYERRRRQVGDSSYLVNDEDLTPYVGENALPHPSSDGNKWWITDGQGAKVPVLPPRPGMVLNPDKVNPFQDHALNDWVEGRQASLEGDHTPRSVVSLSSSTSQVPVPPPRSKSSKSSGGEQSDSLLDVDSEHLPFKSLV